MSERPTSPLDEADEALARNAIASALELCDAALAADPTDARALDIKAKAYMRRGNIDDAISVLESLCKLKPRDAGLLARLGAARLVKGNPGEAAAALADALAADPSLPEARLHLGMAQAMLGDFVASRRTLAPALAHQQTAARAAMHLAHIAASERRWSDMAQYCLVWCERDSTNPQAFRSLAQAQWEMGARHDAVASYRRSLNLGDRSPVYLTSFARVCLYADEFEQAAEALAEADRLLPNQPDTMSALALLHTFQGDLARAELCARRALEQNPAETSALRVLVQLKKGKLGATDFQTLAEASARTDLPASDIASLSFLVGDCLDAQEKYAAAFSAYAKANEIALASASPEARYDRANQERFTSIVVNNLPRAEPAKGIATGDVTPIFVVGMPRSGTTLVESVLAAHSMVSGGGERDAMRQIASEYYSEPRARERIDCARLDRWREAYLRDLRPATRPFIVDKHPWNFDCIDLILQVLPEAKIIHVRRNPVETGLSIFCNEFPPFMTFTCALGDIGHYYSQYARLAAHWTHHFPSRILSLQYEEFVADFARSARDLIASCDLPWEEQCLKFWVSQRTISTMTSVAARRPVNNSNGRAERYAAYIDPLVQALKHSGVDLATGRLNLEGSS